MHIMESMMEFMLGRMSKDDKDRMMSEMMDRFFADMRPEDKREMMMNMMPKMMSGMMSGGESAGGPMPGGMPMMGEMMSEMMPHCASMVMPKMPKDTRSKFAGRMIDALVEHGQEGLSDQERRGFVNAMLERMKRHASESAAT